MPRRTQIADRTFWVGHRPETEILYANTYLRQFGPGDDPAQSYNLIIDPASSGDFEVVLSNIRDVVDRIEHLDAVVLNHQDPDLSSSVGVLLDDYIPDAPVLCTDDTGELIHNYHDISPGQLVELEDYPDGLQLPTDDVVVPLAAPFCHFRGSTMLYDPETRVLFSGDLFSSLTAPDATGLIADDTDWIGMRAFHQTYMPTGSAVRKALEQIRSLQPDVETIAPQHGRIITGDYVDEYIERLSKLAMGVDILDETDEPQAFRQVLSTIVDTAAEDLGEDRTRSLLADDTDVARYVSWSGRRPIVERDGRRAVELTVRLLADELEAGPANRLRYRTVEAAADRDLSTPGVVPDETIGAGDATSGADARFGSP